MMKYTESFPIEFVPVAHADAVIEMQKFRITVLTSRLLRLEFSPTGEFEDRASQAFWYREQPVPEYEVGEENGRFHLNTAHLQLSCQPDATHLTPDALTVTFKENNTTWHFGDPNPLNLRGTYRTLDRADGAVDLEEGLLSRSGWVVYDDSKRLVFDETGWLTNRDAPDGYQDLYFFGYGTDYKACLADFAKIAGPAPMLPRWALGNWWSRYWAYSAKELLDLMDEFIAHKVPLSVCIVDMDWHLTDTGNDSTGWTGYTWNRELFPDPKAFVAELHQRRLKTALNLHPAEGVHVHEAQYAEMAKHMGIDPESKAPVPFSIADPHFTKAYFEKLHHPQEANGIDFWWTDWQQGTMSGLAGLDPLWWLNHLHFYDLGREGEKRPFIFSRWGGLGNHRYPIGFSGDTVVSWESLAFQPYFTATAANVNYGWWSHDIGGHMGGIEEPELYLRWLQYGVFSPILRLHCTNNPFHERRPWGYDAETEHLAATALRLRHAFIPYLYTMAWRNHTQHEPLIRPMYMENPHDEPAYHCPDQYWYGSELIAAPFVTSADPDTRLSRQVVWLPEGKWFDFFSGQWFRGNGFHTVYGNLSDIPLFAKAGAIVPTDSDFSNGVENPSQIEIHAFPGADNEFNLYEDDGLGHNSLTPIQQTWSEQAWKLTIGPVQGETAHLPELRRFVVHLRGVGSETAVSMQKNGVKVSVKVVYEDIGAKTAVAIGPSDSLTITLTTPNESLLLETNPKLKTCQKCVTAFRMDTWVKDRLYKQLPAIIEKPILLQEYGLLLTESQLRALSEIIFEAGFHRTPTRSSENEMILLWNNRQAEDVSYKWQAFTNNLLQRTSFQQEQMPKFGIFMLGDESIVYHSGGQLIEEGGSQSQYRAVNWQFTMHYADYLTINED